MKIKQHNIEGLTFAIGVSDQHGEEGDIAYITGTGADAFYAFVEDAGLTADGVDILETRYNNGYWVKQQESIPAVGSAGTPGGASTSVVGNVPFSEVAGGSVSEAILKILFPPTTPTVNVPAIVLVSPATATVRIPAGTNYTTPMSVNWDAAGTGATPDGDATWKLNAVDVAAVSGVYTPALTDITTVQTIEVSQAHTEGTMPVDSYGNDVPGDRLAAGSSVATILLQPFWTNHHGVVPKGTFDFGAGPTALRAVLDALATSSDDPVTTIGSFELASGNDYIIAVDNNTLNAITVMSSGFSTSIGELLGTTQVDNSNGSGTHGYRIFRINGQASASQIDSVTLS